MATFRIECIWIPASYGGRSTKAQPGLRLGIRWQRHIQEWLAMYRDVTIVDLAVEPTTGHGSAELRPVSEVPEEWLKQGELVELLEGYKVVAVGRIA